MSKFGQYQLLERVAVGGMGEVYRARSLGEEGFEKPVAIKRILPAFASDVRFVEMLVTEARIHAPLSHRNIVQIHDLGISEDHEYFIVLEFVDGHDLGALLARLTERRVRGIGPARVPDAVALYIAVELGEGLHFAHEARDERNEPLGLVHRDISPSNVLLSYAGEVKLSDFGLAKRRTDHSIVGSLKGQLAYMSPEQARRAPLDRRTDIFSLGAVLFEMLTGQPLRTITDDISGWQQVASGVVPSARQARPDLLPALEQLLTQALAPDPRDRFPDARAFVAEVRGALDLLPRSRAGEAGELTALLRGLLPPGRPRPAKAQSKVIRLLSELAPPAPPAPAPQRPRDSGLVKMPVAAPAPAALAAASPPPAVRAREESRPPPARPPAEAEPAGSASDGQMAALLDVVAPPITSGRGSGLHPAPPITSGRGSGLHPAPPAPAPPQPQPTPPSRPVPQPAAAPPPAFRAGPPPIPAAARPPPTPPPIPWPPPPVYPGAPPPELPPGPAPLSSAEEIEQLEDLDEMPTLARAPRMPMPAMQPPERMPMPEAPQMVVSMVEMQPQPDLPPMAMGEMPMPAMPDGSPMIPMQDMQQPMIPMQDMQQPMIPMQDMQQPMIPMQDMQQPLAPSPEMMAEGWGYPDGMSEMASQPPPYPVDGVYAVEPQMPGRGRRGHVLGIVAGVAVMIVAFTHYVLVPMNVLAVWGQPARLEVDSAPTGAEVYIDGRRLSARTPTFTEVKRDFDPHVVELRLEGFLPERQELRYSRTVKLAVSVRLVPGGDTQVAPAPPAPPTPPPSVPRAGRAGDPVHVPAVPMNP
jgi:serine/threonine protein kinase